MRVRARNPRAVRARLVPASPRHAARRGWGIGATSERIDERTGIPGGILIADRCAAILAPARGPSGIEVGNGASPRRYICLRGRDALCGCDRLPNENLVLSGSLTHAHNPRAARARIVPASPRPAAGLSRDEREEEDYTEGCLHVWSAIAARDYRGLEGFRPMFIAPRGSEEFETENVGVPRA